MRWLALALIFAVLLPMPWVLPSLIQDCRYDMIPEIVRGDLDAVRYRLDHGCDPNHKEPGMRLPLERAVDAGQYEVAALLVEHGALPDLEKNGGSVLVFAVEKGATELVHALLDRGLDPNKRLDYFGRYPLHAAHGGNSQVVVLLVAAGANPDVQDRHGRTPLHLLRNKDLPVASALVEAGADLEVKDELGQTPLARALFFNKTLLADLLIDHGADLETTDHEGVGLLHLVAYRGTHEQAVRLLEAGLSPDAVTSGGSTALHVAVRTQRPEMVKLLIDAGADLQASEVDGRTALQAAAISGNIPIARMLLDAGADANTGDAWNHTPLHEAAFADDLPMARLLVEKGAKKDAKASYGLTLQDAYKAGRTGDLKLPMSGK